jgi:patched domain-containing protein
MEEAISHAGPSITITSFTNAVAFFFGSQTSLIALQSFCVFAGIAILMLFYACLTVFSAVLVFDLRRQARM